MQAGFNAHWNFYWGSLKSMEQEAHHKWKSIP